MILKGATSKDGRKFTRIGVNRFHCHGAAVKAIALPGARKSTTAYRAALVSRLSEDWPVAILSADAANRWSLRQLRARARDLERNGGIHGGYLSLVEADVIGSKGIGVQMKIRKDPAAWSDAMDYGDAKPVKGRVIDDPNERGFLKALQLTAGAVARYEMAPSELAALKDRDPAWASAVLRSARALKAGGALFNEDAGGTMTMAGELDRYANYLVEKEWKAFSKRGACDVTGKHSLMDLCRLTLRTSARDGDALLLVYRGFDNRHGLAFQLIEGDYLDDYYNVESLPNGNRIRMGVELDRFGRKVAFWVFAHHPGDYGVEGVNSYDPRRRRIAAVGTEPDPHFTDGRPEAVQAIHVTKSKRAEETRAVPWITPAMELIHHIETLKEAEITAARAEACKHVVYERDLLDSQGEPLDWSQAPDGTLSDEIQPAMSETLPPGYTAKLIDPNHPNPHFPDFLKSMKREVAMALNKCYAILFGDLAEANYSNLRGGLQNQRECDKMDQAWFGDDVFTPMFEAFLEMSLLSGALPFRIGEFERLNAPELKFRRWPWVDPKNDAETAILLIENKLRTRAQVIADMSSDDFEETIDELDYEAGYIAAKPNLAAAEERTAKLENPPAPSPEGRAPARSPSSDEATKALAIKSACLGDVAIADLPEHAQQLVREFIPTAEPSSKVMRYQMTVPELLAKADQHNLQTAQRRVAKRTIASSAAEVLERKDKHILLLNDKIIDGHHHLAKAEKGKVTSSLPVLDLTPLRYQAPASA